MRTLQTAFHLAKTFLASTFLAITLLASTLLVSSSTPALGQQSSASAPAQAAPAKPSSQPPAPKPVAPSELLQPSLDGLLQTVTSLKLDKWKGGTVRSEAAANISSIQRDLQSSLPALLAEADHAPGTLSKVLPVSRNIDALYDVVLRVLDGARVAGSGEQVGQLQQAMSVLEKSRQALNLQMQDTAATTEKQLNDVQLAWKSLSASTCPTPPTPAPATAATAAKKKPVKKKPTPAKPTTTPSASPSTNPPTNP